jgi:hypothetical protein
MGRSQIYATIYGVVVVTAMVGGMAYVGSRQEDSGVLACQELAERDAPFYGTDVMTPASYDRWRRGFDGSTDNNLRTVGTRLVDVAWQLAQTDPAKDDYRIFRSHLSEQLSVAYSQVISACADNGVIILSPN